MFIIHSVHSVTIGRWVCPTESWTIWWKFES